MAINKPTHHILVCNSFRASGTAQGVCHRKEAIDLVQYLENEIIDRGIDALVSTTGCLKICDHGPVMVVYPAGDWYGEVDEERIDTILDALEEGEKAEELLLA